MRIGVSVLGGLAASNKHIVKMRGRSTESFLTPICVKSWYSGNQRENKEKFNVLLDIWAISVESIYCF